MQRRVRAAALPVRPGESTKAQITKAAARLREPRGKIYRLWYTLIQRIDAATADNIRQATDGLGEIQVRIIDLERPLDEMARGTGQLAFDLSSEPDAGPRELDAGTSKQREI